MSPKRKSHDVSHKQKVQKEREMSHDSLISDDDPIEVPIKEDDSTDTETITNSKNDSKIKDDFVRCDFKEPCAEHSKSQHVEHHGGSSGEYIKSFIFGGLDGIITTFAIISAAAGAGETYKAVLIFGISNVLADGFSMGFGEYISGNAEYEYARRERAREEWEVEHSLDLEIQEMVQLYEGKGLSNEDAKVMVDIISKDPKIFVDFMMVDELGLLVNLDDTYGSLKQGIVMFISFVLFGMMPLLVYFGGVGQGTDRIFVFSIILTVLSLFILGAIKGYIMSANIVVSGLLMLFNGCCSGVVSYGVSVAVSTFLKRV